MAAACSAAASSSTENFHICGPAWNFCCQSGIFTPNLPTQIIPTKIARLKLSRKFPMGLGIRWCMEAFVSMLVQSQSQKSLPGGGGV